MALTGNIIHDAFAGNHSIINYVIFVSVFAMLSLFYLIGAAIMDGFAIPLAMLALDAINTLLFLIGGIALAAYLGVHSCSNKDYVIHNKVTNGSFNPTKRCREAQAVTAFLWFGFLAWLGSLVLSGLSSRGGAGGLRRGKLPVGASTSVSTTSIRFFCDLATLKYSQFEQQRTSNISGTTRQPGLHKRPAAAAR
ncbi:MAG: hypothetical protein Q9220_007273 [cf. Caloplaca sp. 1 TL-2023]